MSQISVQIGCKIYIETDNFASEQFNNNDSFPWDRFINPLTCVQIIILSFWSQQQNPNSSRIYIYMECHSYSAYGEETPVEFYP